MKVLAALILALGSAAALGSGPYLPSGWKPQGPAFILPSELRNPVPIDIALQESEGSSSDFLREYGPPDVQEISQALPEVVTEQPFVVIEAKFGEEDISTVGATTEVVAELKAEVIEETQTTNDFAAVVEEVNNEDNQEVAQARSLNIDTKTSEAGVSPVDSEVIVTVKAEESSVNANIKAEVVEEVKTIQEGVRNIAEAIINIENETVEQRVPEGFLEYGPPGFREYGPPSQDSLLRTNTEEKTEAEKIDSNETRRRRFSPKFRSSHKH
ncbi:hypothetical protein evm_005389 [Chilo suppressalis]|nr:hypothetical protein evm_005389 [Chilo suppressalis]